jgi:hypothetical protein
MKVSETVLGIIMKPPKHITTVENEKIRNASKSILKTNDENK